jgi:hypothetical protein
VIAPEPVHWYHLFCGGDTPAAWLEPVSEHADALHAGGFPGRCLVGLVGSRGNQAETRNWLAARWPEAEILVAADSGFEQVTLSALHAWSQGADPGTPVLYCHTKGAFQPTPYNQAWRRAITGDVVTGWAERMGELAAADAAGPHWLTHEEFPARVETPFFGGNFWWANAGYLAALPALDSDDDDRYKAEWWIGLGAPRACNVRPGWPEYAGWVFPG